MVRKLICGVVISVGLFVSGVSYAVVNDNGQGVGVRTIDNANIVGKEIVFFNDKTITVTSQIFNNAGSVTVGNGSVDVSDIYDEKLFVISVGTRTNSGTCNAHIYAWVGTTTANTGVIVYDVPGISTNGTATTFKLNDYYHQIAVGLNTGGDGTMTGCNVRCNAVNYKRQGR